MNTKSNILILSTSDVLGAYEVAFNLTKYLKEDGHNVCLIVKKKTKRGNYIKEIELPVPSLTNRILNKIKSRFSNSNLPETNPEYLFLEDDESKEYINADILLAQMPFQPDLIICGMTNGFVTTSTLAKFKSATGAKIYTWLVDMGPITGGCHYSWGCEGYKADCSDCPAIVQDSQKEWPKKNLEIKLKNVKEANIQALAGSQWVANQAAESALYRGQKKIYNTNNCIDTRLMNDHSRLYAKHIFNFPEGSKIIFAGSQNTRERRKGLVYFVEALNLLWDQVDEKQKESIYILIAGESSLEDESIKKIPFKKLVIDFITDYRYLSLAYQAADLFVCPSIEDSGPMMVSEALACGTPVVGFDTGTVYTMIENGYNGYKTEMKNSRELSECIKKIIELSPGEYEIMSKNAIEQVKKKSSHLYAVSVINEILNQN